MGAGTRTLSWRFPPTLVALFGIFTLWDFYLGPMGEGTRLLDLLAVGFILSYLLFAALLKGDRAAKSIRLSTNRLALILAFISLFVVSGVIGSLREPLNFIRPTSGVWLGVFVFVVYYCINVTGYSVSQVIGALVVIHALALLIQFIVFYSSGELINYQQMLGAEPRVFSAIFRPSGLFLEPGSYAVTAIMLLLLRWNFKPELDLIAWVGLTSVFLTLSLFGVLAMCSVLVWFNWKKKWFWPATGAVAFLAILCVSAFREMPQVSLLIDRLLNFGDDASVSARYGVTPDTASVDTLRLWFGQGLGNDYHYLGSSGLAFLVASVGIVGALLWLAIGLGLSAPGRRISVLFSVLLVLVAAPLWTMMFWWAWLGLLLNPSHVHDVTVNNSRFSSSKNAFAISLGK